MKILLNNKEIEVYYTQKKTNRNTWYRFKNGNLYVTGPKKLSDKQLANQIESIKDKLIGLMNKTKTSIPKSETIHYLGKELNIQINESNKNSITIENDTMIINTRNLDDSYVSKLVKKYYTESAREYIGNLFPSIFREFNDLFIIPKLEFKYTKTFFGKCYTKQNKIVFSGMCMRMEPLYILCVIYHEICHLKYLGHQDNFYRYFESHFPNAKRIQHQFRMLKYNDKY